jgi:hypothetical protein
MLSEGIRVSKSNPCPVCHKTDWCYTIGSGDTSRVLCTRLKRDSLLLPDYLEITSDRLIITRANGLILEFEVK